MTNQASLAKATKQLMLKEPFYGLFLIMMNKVRREDLPTAGVSKNGINVQLAINPIFWDNLSLEYRVGILKHEILHVSFQHLLLRDSYKDKMLFNIAADLEINQYIDRSNLPGGSYPSIDEYKKDTQIFVDEIKRKLDAGEFTEKEAHEEGLKIPGRAIFLEDYKKLNLKAKGGTDYYYKELEKTMDKNGNSSHPALNDLMNGGKNPAEHETWGEFDSLTPTEKKLVQKQMEYQLKEVANQVKKGRGTIPGEFQGLIDELLNEEPPKFDWRGYLRNFAGGSTETKIRKTKRKKSKRFPGAPAIRVEEKLRILFAIDTSGSVCDDELAEAMHEVHHMHRTGTEIEIIQCDTAISSIEKYRKPADGKIKVYGRGGKLCATLHSDV